MHNTRRRTFYPSHAKPGRSLTGGSAPHSPLRAAVKARAVPSGVLIWGADLTIVVLSCLMAVLLRFDFRLVPAAVRYLGYSLPAWALAKGIVFLWCDVRRGRPRHTSIAEATKCGFRNVAGSGKRGERVFIYGAGAAGAMLLAELKCNANLQYKVCGFIDDDRRKVGRKLNDVPILGRGLDLRILVARYSVTEVLIAVPSAGGGRVTRILEYCRAAGVRFKTVPGLAEILSGSVSPVQVRDVAVEDLLGRSAVELDLAKIRRRLRGRVVLITGAAGSIGSELCRQVARVGPRAIVALDAGETPMFHIAAEMRERFPEVPFYAEIGNIQNRTRLSEIFSTYEPSVVYHAAAYKHVPLMESNVFEAVENNVLGTFTLAVTAADFGVESFVMISSDKAVRPTNVMGATKRVAELLIRSLQGRGTCFVSVRFGNVLGSQGSVVPLFKKQIAAGGPVTVTHPEMRRYFMTIPEAVQLVLQASTMGKGGEIFVLDMGQPVKIVDLARKLILLSGLRPETDIQIRFTGIRPGEKLYEELSTYEEHTLPTCHEKIKIFAGNGIAERMTSRVNALRDLCESRDRRGLIRELHDIVPEYTPSADLRALCGEQAAKEVAA